MTTEVAVPICGPSNNSANDCQRSINLFPRKIQRQGEKSLVHLVSGPGRALHVDLDNLVRGSLVMDNRLFVLSGPTIKEVYAGRHDPRLGNHPLGRRPRVDGRMRRDYFDRRRVGLLLVRPGSEYVARSPMRLSGAIASPSTSAFITTSATADGFIIPSSTTRPTSRHSTSTPQRTGPTISKR
jgi:hypothetical protein